jgi:branched-chain amino acid transport system ATP-binding protein
MNAPTALLQLSNVYTAYDKADVLSDISLSVAQGSITCILGSNGSGKSTIIRSILGLTRPRVGSIRVAGRDITQMPTHLIHKVGVACIPEGRKVFPKLTVEENLRIGAYRERSNAVIARRLERVYEIFPRLRERLRQLGGTMSGGEQAMLSIGRGLMSEPKLLLIDEPSLGLSPLFVQEAFDVVKRINTDGVTVLLVEQNVHQTLAISHHGYVLMQGRVVAQGTMDALRDNDEVKKAYFG